MIFLKIILNILLLFSLTNLYAQQITNVVARQDGNNVVITYNLQCEGDADIS
jgi:hypothetical protein